MDGVSVSCWWPVVKSMATLLAERNDDILAYPGENKTRKYGKPVIEVLWDDEVDPSAHLDRRGVIVLWVDCYVACSDTKPEVAYDQMYNLQQKVFKSLLGDKEADIMPWNIVAGRDLNLAFDLEVIGIASQGKIARPSFSSRIVLRVTWKRKFNF